MNAKNNEWIYNGNTIEVIPNDLTSLIPVQQDVQKDKIKRVMNRMIKRFIDILGGIMGIMILIPLTIMIGIANLIIKDKGSLFYVQDRIGKNGKIFKMYKFRSMVVDADEKLQQYLEENEEARKEYAQYKKLKNDPRVTKIGKFLRKTSIDEFPQFINVLKGDMSLVGPRPYLLKEKEEMGIYYQKIVQVKPGLTGPWQIAGRSNLTFEDRARLDREYAEKHGNTIDLKILLKTVVKVLAKDGAM